MDVFGRRVDGLGRMAARHPMGMTSRGEHERFRGCVSHPWLSTSTRGLTGLAARGASIQGRGARRPESRTIEDAGMEERQEEQGATGL